MGYSWLPFLVYAAIPKHPQKNASVHWLLQERDMLYRAFAADTFGLHQVGSSVQVGANGQGIDLIFMDSGVKINDAYYREVRVSDSIATACPA